MTILCCLSPKSSLYLSRYAFRITVFQAYGVGSDRHYTKFNASGVCRHVMRQAHLYQLPIFKPVFMGMQHVIKPLAL